MTAGSKARGPNGATGWVGSWVATWEATHQLLSAHSRRKGEAIGCGGRKPLMALVLLFCGPVLMRSTSQGSQASLASSDRMGGGGAGERASHRADGRGTRGGGDYFVDRHPSPFALAEPSSPPWRTHPDRCSPPTLFLPSSPPSQCAPPLLRRP